eukprot:XP_001702267.1 cell wall protein pherophorin-C18 [Chlamydomonas reinhardtii]
MKVAVVAAALAALVAVAAAQPPPPGFARFPYGSCSKSSPYRTYEATFPQGQSGNVFCWTLQYQGGRCSDPGFQACCQNDVHKFSLAFEPSCAPGFKASATLDGKAIAANNVVLETPPNADKRMTLAVKNLGLAGPEVEGRQVCITVQAGNCRTLASILPVFDQSPLWQNSLWSDDHACCGVSRGSPPSPPPSPNPPLPWFDYYCDEAVFNLLEIYQPFKDDGTIISGAGEADIICKGTNVTVCGVTKNEEAGRIMAQSLREDSLFQAAAILGIDTGRCYPALSGYTFITTPAPGYDNSPCTPQPSAVPMCGPAPPSWPEYPSCRGKSANDYFQFLVGTRYTVAYGDKTSEYCVPIEINDINAQDARGQTCYGKNLNKVQFYLDYSRRYQITGIAIKYNNGSTFTRSQSWGPVGSNSLKITSLDWSVSDVARLEPQICLTIKSGTTLTDLSMDKTKTLWAATFSADHYCCPIQAGSPFTTDGVPVEL